LETRIDGAKGQMLRWMFVILPLPVESSDHGPPRRDNLRA
jgi:hypothetical protein